MQAPDEALIVAEDTNLKDSKPEDMVTLEDFLIETGLTDSCRYQRCGDDRIDRIKFHSSPLVTLEPILWITPDEFIDGDGEDLSGHEPVSVVIQWTTD